MIVAECPVTDGEDGSPVEDLLLLLRADALVLEQQVQKGRLGVGG